MKIINNVQIFLKDRINTISLSMGKKTIYFIIFILIILYFKKTRRLLNNKFKSIFIPSDHSDQTDESDPSEQSETINKNIKLIYKKNDKNIKILTKKYNDKTKDYTFKVTINSATCSIPLYNLRTYKDLDFYFNFIIHDFNNEKINNLIMVKDIQKWTSSASLTNEDLNDDCVPIYFLKKNKDTDDIKIYEYLKVFIQTDINNIKSAFISKGDDYDIILKDIGSLINKKLIKDLLDSKDYNIYNLSKSDRINEFLDRLLSFLLVSESLIGEDIILDLHNHIDNTNQYNHFFNIINSDCVYFNTTI